MLFIVVVYVLTFLLTFWFFEAGWSVRQMVADVTGYQVEPIVKPARKKNKSV